MGPMSDLEQISASTQAAREDYWRTVGEVEAQRVTREPLDGDPSWPAGPPTFVRVRTAHAGILASDGLSAAADAQRPTGLGLEVYLEGRELAGELPAEAQWLGAVLEEVATAVAGAGASAREALDAHELLTIAVGANGAPADWAPDHRVVVLLGVEMPGRERGFSAGGPEVRMVTVTPLRPTEAATALTGADGRSQVAAALAGSGWHSYAETARPAVV